jgi:hypothetical protein
MVSQSLGMTAGSSASSNRSRGVGGGGSGLTLRYKNVIVSSPDETLRRSGVMKSFGPTYEGDTMKYPGIVFLFDDVAGGAVIRTSRATNPDEHKRAEVKKIIISQRGAGDIEADPFEEVAECPVMDGELRTVKLQVSLSSLIGFGILMFCRRIKGSNYIFIPHHQLPNFESAKAPQRIFGTSSGNHQPSTIRKMIE